jgi:exo-beta-1,3-glucanase (GH17 family)
VTIATAVEKTSSEYQVVKSRYPGKYIGIGETGWPTAGSFDQTTAGEPSLANQKTYYEGLTAWAKENQVLTFWFEGFDESWKDPTGGGLEAHWGLFTADRKPKLAVSQDF